MLSYPAAIPLSNRTLNHLADLIREHRAHLRSRWRRLNPGQQALLALAHLRNGDTYTRLAAGFAISTTTVWRYIRRHAAAPTAGSPASVPSPGTGAPHVHAAHRLRCCRG